MSTARTYFGLLLACVLVAATAPLVAQRSESPSSRLFPGADRVFADFPDDPHRWAALTALFGASMERLPDGTPKASYDKSSNYEVNIGLLEQKFDQMGKSSPQAKEFFDQIEALRNDKAFRKQVLDKYGISQLPTGTKPPKPTEPKIQKTGEQLVREASPYWLATIIAMYLAIRMMVRAGGNQAVPARSGGGDLPASLQVVSVLGRQYPVELQSGMVVEEKTWTEQVPRSITTPGQIVTVNDQQIQLPTQTHMYSETVRKDRLCVADPAGNELFWNLSGGALEARPSHVLSRIGRPVGDEVMFLMACNHTTGQVASFDGGIHAQHYAPFFRAFVVAAIIGTVGFLYGGWEMIPMIQPDETFTMNALGLGIFGLIGSTIMGFFMAWFTGARTIMKRDKEFASTWAPKYREFFKQVTPAVLARFRKS